MMGAKNEITFAKSIRITSQEELNMLKRVFSNFDYVFSINSLDGRIQYINSVLPALLGDTQDSFIGQTAQEIIRRYVHPDDLELTMQAVNAVISGQRIQGFENRYRLPDGSYQRFSWMLIPLVQENVFYAIAGKMAKNGTGTLKEDDPEKPDIKLHNVFHNISDYFYVLDNEWKFIYVNASSAQLFFEVKKQETLGKFYWDVFPETDDFYFLKFSEAKFSQKHVCFEAFSLLTSGWVRVNVYPSPEGLSIYFRDISEQKKLEKSLEDEQKRLYAILNGLPGLVYLRTHEGKVVFANHTFRETHGEPDNRKCFEILFNKEEPCSYCQLSLASNISNQWQCVIKDTIYEVFQHPFDDLDGTPLFLMQLLDITKRKLAEEEIAHLDRLNLVGELAASIAHEVRNPMTTVRGFLQILKNKNTIPENAEYYDLMISELDRANSILTEFLSVAKASNKLFTQVKLHNLVDSLYPLVMADATNQDKQVVLETKEVPELSLNEREMRQLVLNLTRNGLEAMQPKGTLTIKTYRDADSVVLAVQDQGSGISQEILERIGTPFLTTKEGGTGLGLSTCFTIAERHNAKIEVTSSASGTRFLVRFKGPAAEIRTSESI
ncbi:ATP-binding protein [Desulfosporosinus sp. PR]|uniref:ATP-binding protein n=1 Tax=Candidatus Desulfosporosinus nitrosoreducens TaxID=3401928 RepID=UPI0027E757CD|nr:ATP-binding protein [Desulfosporosinus sp. PR]MDQ7095299.1 ATP-binding protein [Desulfosporosinus sp. PR]